MKVGILTIHHAINYGAVLQAWSLQQEVQRMGHEAAIIDYRPPAARAEYRKEWNRSLPARLRLLKTARFERFLRRELRTLPGVASNTSDLELLKGRFDALICGSDQIWCLDSFRGFDPNFFLEFAARWPCRRISYAPSFGDTARINDPETRRRIGHSLQGFASLSVRDTNSQTLVLDAIRSDTHAAPSVPRLLDPTFLANFSSLLNREPSKKQKPYILVYANVMDSERRWIRELADARGLEIISVSGRFVGADRTEYLAGPDRWLHLFRDASFVATNFFHGVVFSLIFSKEFVMLGRDSKRIKTMDLLDTFSLQDRWIERLDANLGKFSRTPADVAKDSMNVESLAFCRGELVEDSRGFLEGALHA